MSTRLAGDAKELHMAELKTLAVTRRNALGKNPNRRLRAKQVVPAVFYNAEGLNITLQAEMLPLQKIFGTVGRTTVFNLEIDDNGSKTVYPALFWQVQYHPVKNVFSHIDFYGVDLEKEIRIRVPLEFTGTAKGSKVGGSLEVYREYITVTGKPLSLPSKLAVDVTELGIGDTLTIGDLQPGEGVRVMAPATQAVVSVVLRGAEEDAADETGSA